MKKIRLGKNQLKKGVVWDEVSERIVQYNLVLERETEKAISCFIDNIHYIRSKGEGYSENEYVALSPMRKEAWLPKSQITLTAEYIELPDWLVRKKGLKYFCFDAGDGDEFLDVEIKAKDEEWFIEDKEMFLQEYPDSSLFS